jgi:FixJ family two-component response regulator
LRFAATFGLLQRFTWRSISFTPAFMREAMPVPRPIVFVIDDEPSLRASITRVVRAAGLDAQVFSSAQDFLRAKRPDVPGCLVLDVRLRDASGLDLQNELVRAHVDLPIIFVTRYGDVPMSVRAMKAGAVEFLTTPYRDQELLEAVKNALERHRVLLQHHSEEVLLQERYQRLTPRQREVFPLVTRGMLNKQIAARLGTSEKTIKAHRGQVMRKMNANSLADLIRMGQKLGITDSGWFLIASD